MVAALYRQRKQPCNDVTLHDCNQGRALEIVQAGIDETLSYYTMPAEHWRCLRTNDPLETLMREIRRRTRVVGAFPDGHSALMLVAARLRHVAATRWGTKGYLEMNRLAEVRAIA
jgi:transposase-like protein